MYRFSRFSYFANQVARTIAHPIAFLIVLILVLVWLLTGPLVGFNGFWRLVFSSSTTIVTFLLLFLIQHTQAREMAAIQLKLNELVRASEGTHNALLDIEQLTDRDYDQIRENYSLLARQAREQIKNGKLRWATARIQMESLDSLLDPAAIATVDEPASVYRQPGSSQSGGSLNPTFERLARVALRAIGSPIVMVLLNGEDRQWCAIQEGVEELANSVRQSQITQSLCRQVVASGMPVVYSDVRNYPLVKSDSIPYPAGLVAFAAVPLLTAQNYAVGAFCAIDGKPRCWTENDISVMQDLAGIAAKEMAEGMQAYSATGDSQIQEPAQPPSSIHKEDCAAPGRATILIVDDSATNQKLLSHRLEGVGYSVFVSPTGQEALECVQTRQVDLILLDMMLPGMDGEHVLQILQADEMLKHIPVIMISALDEEESISRCLQLGARDYLLKPFDPQHLQACIETHLAAVHRSAPA